MIKHIFTLMRGVTNNAADEFTDRHALTILEQQMRGAAQGVTAARKAVAIAIAQSRQEQMQHEALIKRIADLEQRTVSALKQDKQGLAREAATCIALMESERDTSQEAQDIYTKELARLKLNVQKAEMKLRELRRGQRLVTATDKVQKLREQPIQSGLSTLDDAGATLDRLRQRQTRNDLTSKAVDEMLQTGNPVNIAEKLAESGCGTPLKSSADEVFARLSKKASKKST
jgi:phage shock protein A